MVKIIEAPIEDIGHIGAWGDKERNSSFRDPLDRKLVSHPTMIKRLKRKFAKHPDKFNMYFVNSPEANRYTEVGVVSMEWLESNMPKTLADLQAKTDAGEINFGDSDSVNIIFTNNKGAARIPMTPWIIAHRLGHALNRYDFGGFNSTPQVYSYHEGHDYLVERVAGILNEAYGIQHRLPNNYRNILYSDRFVQNMFKKFYEEIGTFRSAREHKLREHFEMYNELFAQYLVTSGIQFNPIPLKFRGGPRGSWIYYRDNPDMKEYYDEIVQIDLKNTLTYHFDNAVSEVIGKILVM